MTGRALPRWPLFVIGAPAAVAVWSGWVGLGGLCGFGPIHPLPGIAPGFTINTAITLPVGIEAYGSYALGAWLRPGVPEGARAFGRNSAIGALALGMTGQVIYHLLNAAHATRAPWPVVMFTSVLPVVALGFGAALAHLLRGEPVPADVPRVSPGGVPGGARVPVPGEADAPGAWPVPAAARGVPAPAQQVLPGAAAVPGGPGGLAWPGRDRDHRPGGGRAAAGMPAGAGLVAEFAEELAAGQPPSIRVIRARLRVGQERARQVQAALAAYLAGAPVLGAPAGPAAPTAGGAVPGPQPAGGVPALAGSRP